ncbi:ST3 beta-galactoside alpha-2,3-sialyltransferase 8 [Poecilia reticulata]|uniref:CMP-N-acetylneuraminate-beta-galactosamide-alpha-2,3-sialyltransferase 2 n=1 Tax=Poecilia reticulata TaxID=8081 RepID=A0A3P9PIM6_POERE|nr:PREDICTED: CMP-N-acetylneuraminate-beta-galactosamide-alpha-2,3-sialyltransferase 2-like [Poecilia reticulata]XP_008407370.1 PREDICTED: CMP-N-acetylneuraminate-beta-galactosamide-alpha-2,3-sialyltransferase 2-like [Poecilia reticulata]
MLVRRKLYVVVAIAVVLLLMLASQSIQRRHILPLSIAYSRAIASSRDTVVEPNVAPAVLSHPSLPPSTIFSEADVEKEKKEEEDNKEENKEHREVKFQNPKSCGCSDSCISDLQLSVWFSDHYNSSQQPILHAKNNNFDPDAIAWWQGLQRSDNDHTLKEVMAKMFQVISPPPVDTTPVNKRCRKCAVVGNSGNLRWSGHGKLIDSHNFIIRMNKAVTQGFEKDVGNRTTHHFLYPESAVDVQHGVNLVLLPFKLKDLEWLTSALSTGHIKRTYMRVRDRVGADRDKVLVVNPVFFKYVHDHWTEHHGRYPSTGMLAIVFALHTCDQVSVFGYGADKMGNWHHYWEENPYGGAFRKTGVHNADFETDVIHRLDKEGKIKFYL